MTRFEVLPPEQRKLLPSLLPLRELGYTLYGGTAIALHLGHRRSVDFDFFSDRPLIEDDLAAAMPFLVSARTTQRAPRSWTVITRPQEGGAGVKLSFFGGLRFGRVGQPVVAYGGELRLASLDDLLGHKLEVLLQRIEAKEYLDIAAMLRAGQPLHRGLAAAQALFATFAPAEAVRTLTYFEGGDLDRVTPTDRRLLESVAGQIMQPEPLPIVARTLD